RAAPGAPSISCCLRSRGERRAAASAASRRNGSPRSRRIPGGSATLRAPGRSLDEVAGRLPGARLANGRDGLDRALLVLEVRFELDDEIFAVRRAGKRRFERRAFQ